MSFDTGNANALIATSAVNAIGVIAVSAVNRGRVSAAPYPCP